MSEMKQADVKFEGRAEFSPPPDLYVVAMHELTSEQFDQLIETLGADEELTPDKYVRFIQERCT